MITFYNPSPLEYLFSQPNSGSESNSNILQRIKFIFAGSILSASAAVFQCFHASKVIGSYLFSFIITTNITFSDLLLESYKTVAYAVSVFVLPILAIIISPQSVIQLYENLRLFKSPISDSTPLEKSIIEDDLIHEEPVPLNLTYEFYKKNYEKLDSSSAKKAYIQSKLSSLSLAKKKNRMSVLLNYFNQHKAKFNKESGYYRLSGELRLKEEIELRLISFDITNGHLLDNIGDTSEDRNIVCGVMKDLVKNCDLFPYKSVAYQLLMETKSSEKEVQKKILDSIDDHLKKEIFVKLIKHLNGIAANQTQHLMDAKNLATVFAPNIDSEPDALKSLKSNSIIIDFLQKMIESV